MLATAQPIQVTPTSPKFSIPSISHRPPTSATSAASGSDRDFSRPATPNDILLEPPRGMSFLAYLQTWQDPQVGRWLQEHKCGNHLTAFVTNDIRGDVLLELDNPTLREMGVSSVGDRIRILTAVKQLRQKSSRFRASPLSAQQPAVLINHVSTDSSDSRTSSEGNSAFKPNRKLENGRPPPLSLANTSRSDLPKIDRPLQGIATPTPDPTSALTPRANPPPGPPQPASLRHQNLPPLPPPPRTQPPLPPASTSVGMSSTPRIRVSGQPTLGRQTPTEQLNTPLRSGEYGLPMRPSPGNLGGKMQNTLNNRSLSPSPQPGFDGSKRGAPPSAIQTVQPSQPRQPSHERSHSLPGSARPAASSSASHPYASISDPPPHGLHPPPNLINQLSPIAESFIAQTPISAAGPPSEYRVGRGPFASTPNRPVPPQSIEDIRKKTLKFHLPDEGASRTVNIADCEDGVQVLVKALKKFNKLSPSNPSDSESDRVETDELGGLNVDGWAVFLTTLGSGVQARTLSEPELLSICHSEPDHFVREQGLTLRRVHPGKQKRSKQLANIFGETPPLTRSSSPPSSPRAQNTQSYNLLKPDDATTKKMKRASTVSILTGLGVQDPDRTLLERPNSPSSESASIQSTGRSSKPSRLRNFFGQRPPSELITNHLQDFFPFTEKKVLERTARHSMLRQRRESKRESFMSTATGRASWSRNRDSQALHPRFSTSSSGSGPRRSLSDRRLSTSITAESILQRQNSEKQGSPMNAPRVSLSTEDGLMHELSADDEKRSDTASVASGRSVTPGTHLLPPVSFGSEPFSESFQVIPGLENKTSSRYSHLAELRNKRDTSDTASMLTVDEITAEVESRRASMMPSPEPASEDTLLPQESDGIPFPLKEDQTVTSDDEEQESTLFESTEDAKDDHEKELEDDIDLTDSDLDEDETNEEEVADEDGDGPSKAVTSTGGVRAIKWIKGALIGRGSFGSVYLAMDAQRGLLMAVKQVELPTGLSQNEERKKSMLTALEREIELLKDLQHENIVQYLDSSMDDEFLNIFLEYVPGGSVTALLRNYGAFEEPLVRNFVRQILQGLSYLHGRDIIHRDIKGANILVDNKSCVKISDFGISKRVEDNFISKAHRPSLQGSVFWMAPEVVKQTSYTSKADIWSLGCLCVEMLTGEHPWAKLTQMQAIFKIGSSAKPSIPSDISRDADDFIQDTFNLDYEARPSARTLLEQAWIMQDAPLSFGASAMAALNPPKLTFTS